jgi:hypothetical protein
VERRKHNRWRRCRVVEYIVEGWPDDTVAAVYEGISSCGIDSLTIGFAGIGSVGGSVVSPLAQVCELVAGHIA